MYGVTGAGRAVSYEHAPLACACFPHTLSGSHVWGKEVRANAMGCVLALHPTFSHTLRSLLSHYTLGRSCPMIIP